MKRYVLVLAAMLLGATSLVRAQTAPPPSLPSWERLSQAQRDELTAPIRERWNTQPGERAKMLERARRWGEMSPEQRTHAHRGMKRFERMDPDKRKQAQAMFETMRGLPEAERRALRLRWKQMTPEERRHWLEDHRPPAK